MRLLSKLARVFGDLTDSGRLLQTVGLATEKAQSPNLVHVRGTMKSMLLVNNNVVVPHRSWQVQRILSGTQGSDCRATSYWITGRQCSSFSAGWTVSRKRASNNTEFLESERI